MVGALGERPHCVRAAETGAQMFRLDVLPAAGELAFGAAWEAAPGVTFSVTSAQLDEYTPSSGATRTRLALCIDVRNGSEEPFEFANEFGLFDDAGEFRRRVWVDPAKRPQALAGVRTLAPGETASGEVYVSVELADDVERETFIPSFGGLADHDCQGCSGHDHHEFLPRAMWQPVVVYRDAVTSRP